MDYIMSADRPGGPEVFRERKINLPEPDAGQVLIKQYAIGLNFIDIYHRSGFYPWPHATDLVVGSEGSGKVVAVGEGVRDLKIGDNVAYTHPYNAYASSRIISADKLVKLPKEIDPILAGALMLKGLTAHYLLHDTYKVQKGDVVLVHAAAGGIGMLIGQWLKAKGAISIGTAGSTDKCDVALLNGYDHVINYKEQDFVHEILNITGGEGVDVVYDSVGEDTWQNSLKVLRNHGHFINFGQSSGAITNFSLGDLAAGSYKACRPVLFHYITEPEQLRQRSNILFEAIRSGILNCEINNEYSLTNVAQAHLDLESRKTTGLTVLRPEGMIIMKQKSVKLQRYEREAL